MNRLNKKIFHKSIKRSPVFVYYYTLKPPKTVTMKLNQSKTYKIDILSFYNFFQIYKTQGLTFNIYMVALTAKYVSAKRKKVN